MSDVLLRVEHLKKYFDTPLVVHCMQLMMSPLI